MFDPSMALLFLLLDLLCDDGDRVCGCWPLEDANSPAALPFPFWSGVFRKTFSGSCGEGVTAPKRAPNTDPVRVLLLFALMLTHLHHHLPAFVSSTKDHRVLCHHYDLGPPTGLSSKIPRALHPRPSTVGERALTPSRSLALLSGNKHRGALPSRPPWPLGKVFVCFKNGYPPCIAAVQISYTNLLRETIFFLCELTSPAEQTHTPSFF